MNELLDWHDRSMAREYDHVGAKSQTVHIIGLLEAPRRLGIGSRDGSAD